MADKIIEFKRIDESVSKPVFSTKYSVGFDISCPDNIIIKSDSIRLINSNLLIEKMPEDYYIRIEIRSSMAKKGLNVIGGIIDSDYRNEIKIFLINLSKEDIIINKNDRIVQFLICKNYNNQIIFKGVEKLNNIRSGGLGSTGV